MHATHAGVFSFPSRLRLIAICLTHVAGIFGSQPASAQRDLAVIPPADPAIEIDAMTPDPAGRLNLFAADPDISKPIQINFDAQGRLWVASSETYPQIKPGQKADDKIIVLQDTDGDGVSDRRTVFADGLLIPTGIVPDGEGGCYVGASTELLHFSDTDGDGKADKKRVVLSGFGTEDTHHLLHTLRWGPDGCLYFNQSIYIHSHVETAYGTRHLEGGGIWRYRPDTGELEVFCKGFINPWGHVFDAVGESFVTDGANFEGINYTFPGAVFATSPGATRFIKGMNPGSPKHCGLEILSGQHIPPGWAGDLVTSDFRGHRVCRFTVSPDQSTYVSRQQPEILTSKHPAFRPIDARMGNDGALYIADWYNPIIQHGEVDFRDERRDREHGRIWRVSFEGRPLDPWPDFKSASRDDLIQWLESPSLAVRQFSREHLWRMTRENPDDVLAAIDRWRKQATDDASRATRALEQQWLGEVVGRFESDAFEAATAETAGPARRTSLRSASRVAKPNDALVKSKAMELLSSDDLDVVLEAIVTLGQVNDQESSIALIKTAQRLDAPAIKDPILEFALWQAVRATQKNWTDALENAQVDWKANANGLAYAVVSASAPAAASSLLKLMTDGSETEAAFNETEQSAFIQAIAFTADGETLGELLSFLIDGKAIEDGSLAASGLAAMVNRTRVDRTVPANADELLKKRFPDVASLPKDEVFRTNLIDAIGEWKTTSLLPIVAASLDIDANPSTNEAALRALGQFDDPIAKKTLIEWAGRGGAASVVAIESIATKQPQQAAKLAGELFVSASSESVASTLLTKLVGNQAVAKALPGTISSKQMAPDRARALLAALRNAGGNTNIEAAIRSAGKLDESGWKLTAELSHEILTAAANQGDAARGEAIYRRSELQCIQCHAIGSAGGVVGPNLISLGASSQPDYILESLLEPNAKLKEGYNTLSVLTDDGRVTSGIPVGRDAQSLKLRLADGKEAIIPEDAIEDEQPGKSLMPAGMLDSLTKQELIDLTKFLMSLGKSEPYIVSTQTHVRNYETLVYSDEANKRLNRTSNDTAATEDSSLTWRPITTRVDATLPLEELDRFEPHRGTPPISFIRFDVVVSDGQTAVVSMPTDHVLIWIDGRPTPSDEFSKRSFTTGTHRIVVGVLREHFEDQWSALIQ